MKKILTLVLIPLFFFAACKDDDESLYEPLPYEEQLAIDIEIIKKYLSDNNIDADSTESGLYYIIEEEGTGEQHPNSNSTVTVEYTGKFINEKIFDSGTISFSLSQVIEGWQEGIPLFKEGGKGKLFIPSGLGYGAYDYYNIPANSVLIFEIELLQVDNN